MRNKKTDRAKQLRFLLEGSDFFTAPASTKYHLSRKGGLSKHSQHVFNNLLKLTKKLKLKWSRGLESVYIVAMGHDLCKLNLYSPVTVLDAEGEVAWGWEHNKNHPGGHGELSVAILKQAGIELTPEEEACIRWHMGAFDDKAHWNKYTAAIYEFPNVLWTHTADMMAAHIDEVNM